MKKSTKVLLCLSAFFIALGSLLVVVGFLTGVNPVRAFNDGLMDFTFYEKRTSTFSKDGHYVLASDDVQNLSIDWMGGNVTIEPYDGTEIILEESGPLTFNEHNSLDFAQKGDTLMISFSPEKAGVFFENTEFDTDKELHILLPNCKEWKKMELNTASSDFSMHGMTIQNLEADTVDGDLVLRQTDLEYLSFNSADGSLTVKDSSIATLDLNTVDGDVTGEFMRCPQMIHLNTADGDAKLYLPANSEFTIHMDSAGGMLDSDFTGTYHGDCYSVGNGSAQFDFDTVDGSVQIKCIEVRQ